MKKIGVLVSGLVGVVCLVGYMYRGPIMDLARAFKSEINYMFSINAENAGNVKLGSDDSLASKVVENIEINDSVESGDWNMETAAGEVFNELTDRLPFIETMGAWVEENILKPSSSGEGAEESVEEGVEEDGTNEGT